MYFVDIMIYIMTNTIIIFYSVFSTSTISTEEDSCATSLHLKEKSKTFELQPESKLLSESLVKKPEKPVFVTKFSSAIATVGNTAKFTVIVSGFPKPVIQWYHNDLLIKSSSFYTLVQEKEEHTLVITKITKELEGEYSCTASNQFGKSTCTSYLHVKVKDTKKQEETIGQPPYFVKAIEHVQCAVGSHALLEYTVTGVPLPDVQWYRGSNHLQPSKYCIIVNNKDGSGYLKILGIQQSDSSLYSCKASNPFGETSCSAELIVFLRTVSASEATESHSVSLPEQVRTSLQQGHQMACTIATKDRQTITNEQIDTLHVIDVSTATVQMEQVTHQAALLQSHDVQERVKVVPAQANPVVATPLKQLHMAAMISAVQENQGFSEQHCDHIVSPEVRELEFSFEVPSKLMSAISESTIPLSIVKAEDLIKSETEKMHTTLAPKVIVSSHQVEMKLPILREECTTIKSPEEMKSYKVTEGVKLLYTATSSENAALTECHASELATVESIECLAEEEQAKPVLTSVSETEHTLLKEKPLGMHRLVEETAQLSKDPILKSALITEEKNTLQADTTTGIPVLEHPFSVHSQKEKDQVLNLQLISDQDTLLSEVRFTCEKPDLELADVRKMPVLLHTVSSDDQKTVFYEQATQCASKDTTMVVKPSLEVPAQLHLHSVQSKTSLCKEGLVSVEKTDEQKATQRQEKDRKFVATKEERVELTSDYAESLDVTVEGLKIELKTEARPLSVLPVVSQPVPLPKESPIASEVKPQSAILQKEDWWNDMHAASVSESHSIEEGLADSFKAVEKFTCKTDVEPKVPVQSLHVEEKSISTESCVALVAAEQDFAVQIQEGQSVRQSVLVEEKHSLTGEMSEGFTRSEATKINITTQPLEPLLVSESQESTTLPKELTFVIPVPKSHSLNIKQQLKMTLQSAVACDQPFILADVVQSLGVVEVKEVNVRMEPNYMLFTYLITTAGPPIEITIVFEGVYPQRAALKDELHAVFYSMLNQEKLVFSSEQSNILKLDRPERSLDSKASSYPLSSAILTEHVEMFTTPKKQSAALQTEAQVSLHSAMTQRQTAIQESEHHVTQKVAESKMEMHNFSVTERMEIKSISSEHYKREVCVSDVTVDAPPRQITMEESMDVLIQEDKREEVVTEDILIKHLTEELLFEIPLKDITAEENSKVTLSVRIKGVKSVNWLLNGVLIKSGKEFKCLKDSDSYTLVINKVIKVKHDGEYTCEAVSEAGKISSSSSSRLTVVSRGWIVWILSS